ncbi:hypothetical protein K469DRAFT_693649 [Zopfia rhizophila CBS 207.26]|uniref:Uncharacterized protein n=1 Tax=Zopfia rhizophila CBS 207.26 TaxID=1314779 RepID=A0A6A6DNL9_9PEZI|nr:hypothetical protein K469DRAFT_693649 [Zopfia rhizophila CBS 207.26]
MMKLEESSGELQPSDFHQHWWVSRDEAPEPLPAPQVLKPRVIRRPLTQNTSHKKGAGAKGSRRDPTMAERVDNNYPSATASPYLPTHWRQPLEASVLGPYVAHPNSTAISSSQPAGAIAQAPGGLQLILNWIPTPQHLPPTFAGPQMPQMPQMPQVPQVPQVPTPTPEQGLRQGSHITSDNQAYQGDQHSRFPVHSRAPAWAGYSTPYQG